ncbi:hypothetical protein [Mycolicibacterium holsaticum]|uniref:PE-PPE domain-containing protein n=1 Tax=Mycolicibacterium holsaticum TaxID=152142 RepID=A0A1E3RN96_9MYCO|nr:hypothetical protein [Mycolicibacterium holsaticum]ODQ91330.1 hypothetical protein BHQ17_16995 [Mycolicibacterium holsaticum]
MNASVHPLPTKLAAALMAAGLATTGVFGEAPGDRDEVASLTAEVANASAVTDLLYTAGDAVARASYGIAVAADGAISLPFDIAAALVAGSRAPSIAPSLVSWLVQRYANPSDNYGFSWDSLAWRIKTYSLEPLAALLPQPLSDTVVNLIDAIANGFGDALERILPDPTAGLLATEAFWGTPIGRTMVGVNDVLAAPVWMAWDTAVYLGYLPAELEATFEAALRDPSEIPGLLSNLAYRLLGSGGLLGSLIVEIAAPLEAFPGPIGKLAADVMWGVYDALDAVLSVLPTPIPPVPFATAAPTADTEAVEGASQHGPEVAPQVLTTDQTQLIAVDVPTEDERAADEVADMVDEEGDDAAPPADDAANTPLLGKLLQRFNVKAGNKFVPGSAAGDPAEDTGTVAADPGVDDDGASPGPDANDDETSSGAGDSAKSSGEAA